MIVHDDAKNVWKIDFRRIDNKIRSLVEMIQPLTSLGIVTGNQSSNELEYGLTTIFLEKINSLSEKTKLVLKRCALFFFDYFFLEIPLILHLIEEKEISEVIRYFLFIKICNPCNQNFLPRIIHICRPAIDLDLVKSFKSKNSLTKQKDQHIFSKSTKFCFANDHG